MIRIHNIFALCLVVSLIQSHSAALLSSSPFMVDEPGPSLYKSKDDSSPGIFDNMDIWMHPIANPVRHRQLIKKDQRDQIQAMENMIIRTVRSKKVMNQLMGTVIKEIKRMNIGDPSVEEGEVLKPMTMATRSSSGQRRSVEEVNEPMALSWLNKQSQDILNSNHEPILSVPMHLLRGVR